MQTRPVGLRLIVTYKIVKAILQVLAAVLLLYGAAHGLGARLADFAETLREHAVHAWSNVFAAALVRFTRSRHNLTFTAYALLADAVLSSVEGWAISRGHTWGEWLVVGTTACLIPFEIRALLHHLRVGRVVLLVLNVVIVMYLVRNIRSRRRAQLP
ncbi:MAG TPA: DUF2127 domain-containing protein [Polyangia bacterium]|jgi:uncharacterized membrane protein (DUF2068 family)|nr:DUF2127 domain-containing protein [Polyangia bacterium]